MHVVILKYSSEHDNFINTYSEIAESANFNISLVQRSKKNLANTDGKLKEHYLKDEFGVNLLWWQNPELVNEFVGSLNPDIVHILGLNLPLHFRWIKHYVPENTKLLGEHTGENLWPQNNLWLQQFGLRVVDGFIFSSKKVAEPWIKCAAILKKQPVFDATVNSDSYSKNLCKIFLNLMKGN